MEHLSWHKDCQAVIECVRQALEAHNWRVLRTFDLQSAREKRHTSRAIAPITTRHNALASTPFCWFTARLPRQF